MRECAMVTVQFSRSSSCAIGLPTMFERPMTTASRPDRSCFTDFASIIEPTGVHGASARSPIDRRPTLTGWKPSTSFAGSISSSTLLAVDLLGQRQLHQDAVDVRIGVELGDELEQHLLGRVLGKLVLERLHADLDGLRGLVAHVDLACRILADEHHGEPGREAVLRLEPCHVGGDVGAHLGGNCLAVDEVGSHRRESPILSCRLRPAWRNGLNHIPHVSNELRSALFRNPFSGWPQSSQLPEVCDGIHDALGFFPLVDRAGLFQHLFSRHIQLSQSLADPKLSPVVSFTHGPLRVLGSLHCCWKPTHMSPSHRRRHISCGSIIGWHGCSWAACLAGVRTSHRQSRLRAEAADREGG